MSVTNCFIRGSVVRYVVVRGDVCGDDVASRQTCTCHTAPHCVRAPCTQLPEGSVDVELLHDATRREARGQ